MEQIVLRPDTKGRITLGKLAKGVSSYRVTVEDDDRLILEPYVEIPARERWLVKNEEAMASLQRGLEDSAAGRVSSLGSFSQYADDEDDS